MNGTPESEANPGQSDDFLLDDPDFDLILAGADKLLGESAKTNPPVDEVVRQNTPKESALTLSPEDEFAQKVKAIAIHGKFPQGVELNGQPFVAPTANGWHEDFRTYTDSTTFEANQFALQVSVLGQVFEKYFPGKQLMLAIPIQDRPNRKPSGYNGDSMVISIAKQDNSVRDRDHRHARTADIMMVLPNNEAGEFTRLIQDREDGADIAERFLQKAAPGLLAKDGQSSGIRRAVSGELIILSPQLASKALVESNSMVYGSDKRVKEMIDREAVRKAYSVPAGTGAAPS